MSLASDLMGFGLPPLLAGKLSNGGLGPLTITAAGTTYATSTKIGVMQYIVSVTNDALGSLSVGIPRVGGDTGAMLADDYTVNNAGGSNTVVVRASTGVLISAGGVNDSSFVLAAHKTISLWPISSTQWVGVAGS